MKQIWSKIVYIIFGLSFFYTGDAFCVSCKSLFIKSKSDSAPRSSFVSLPKLLKQIDATARELKGTDNFTSPVAWRKKTAEYGLPGLDLPIEFNGSSLSASKAAIIFEHLGKYSLDMRDMIGGGHARPLILSKNPEHHQIIKDVADGNAYVAIAITEKDAGSNVRAMQSTSKKVTGGYELTGSKHYNARFTTASHVIIFTKSETLTDKLNAFVLPIDYPGLNFIQLQAHGLRGNSFGGVSFDKLFIPESMRIGNEGDGGKIFKNHFLYWRLMMAAAAVGTGKGALEQAVTRMRERQAFGGPIGRFTHLQQPLAEHTAKLHMASLLIQEAAKKIDQNKFDQAVSLVAMAKAEGVEWAHKAADFVMEMYAAEGYSNNVDLAQRVADLQGLRVADGTTHIMRQEVVRSVYGQDFWDMAIGSGE